MQFSELMAVLSTLAIRLQLEEGDLIIQGDDDALEDALWDSLVAHKPQLLALVAEHDGDWLSPAFRITPDMLPLVSLDQAAIERIVASVPGGAANLQDVYPLAPLQEGMLYHHLSAPQGDPYVLQAQFAFDSREHLDAFVQALQWVVERHDILRTAIAWERLDQPLQVVWRHASLHCEEVACDGAGDTLAQLRERYDARHYRLDIRQAPLLRLVHARDAVHGRWVALLLFHHMALDHTALEVVRREIAACLLGQQALVAPAVPFRDHLAQARMNSDDQAHEAFFRDMLGDIDEPTLPYGRSGEAQQVEEARLMLDRVLSLRLRNQARQLGVSVASLMHLALARVLGQLSGRSAVVFGTVLLGRMDAGADGERALGMFINTLPLRVDVGEVGVRDGVLATHARLNALLEHEHASLALAQRCSAVSAPTPLFSALLNYRHSDAGDAAEVIEVAPGIQVLGAQERTNYPLTLNIDDLGVDLRITALVDASMGAERIAGYLNTALGSLALALQNTPQAALAGLNILPAKEREYLLDALNTPLEQYPEALTVHQLFEAQVRLRPEATALIFEQQTLSYAELNQRANQVAHRLLAMGIHPDQRVAICVERGPQMIIGLLGVLKAGAGYVPIDPGYPLERIAFTLRDSLPLAVLVQADTQHLVAGLQLPLIDLDSHSLAGEPASNPHIVGLLPSHLAYVIYTSGSTGLPKGVMVEHRNVTRLFSATQRWFQFNAQDVWALFHSFAFDFSVWEIWGALSVGGQLLIVPQRVSRSPDECYALLCQAGVSVLNQTPSAFRQLIVAQGKSPLQHSLRQVIFGGEALEPGLLKPWYARIANAGTRLVNMYGITETTVHVTYRPLQAADAQLVGVSPIGTRIPDLQLYVLDEQRQPVPEGVVGELYVGGAGVARGYLNREVLTAERFIIDPFSHRVGARLYKTGDLARWAADGSLDYLGRNDDQVKIRGFRIELGEIQACLSACAGVREALVIAREDSPGDQRLVAYWVAEAEGEPSAAQLREQLQVQLADYMVPSAFVRLEAFPLTGNGKLDRKALPPPGSDAFARRAHAAPQGAVETRIAALWQELLGVEQVGRHDNFFALGGHSLLAVKLIERMRQHDLGADVRVLFGQPTLMALAAAVGGQPTLVVPANGVPRVCQQITPDMLPLATLDQAAIERIVATVPGGVANVQDIYALAPLQAGILYHHLSSTAGDPYVLQVQLGFDGIAEVKAFVRALNTVIARYDILRTSVVWEGLDEAVQVVWREAPLAFERFDSDPQAGDALGQLQARFDPRQVRLDLQRAPLLRFAYTQDPQHQRWVGILLLHHLALDQTALTVLMAEMSASLRGRQDALDDAVQYRNYVAQARLGVSQATHEAYFRERLGDIDVPTLAFGLHDVQGDGSDTRDSHLHLEPTLTEGLRAQARRLGVGVASLVHQAWAQVLAQLCGRESVVFGTVLLGRMQGGEGADRALGMFINTLPLRLDIQAQGVELSVLETYQRLAQLLQHEQASLALAQRCSGVAAELPLFNSLLNYRQGAAPAEQATTSWDGIHVLSSHGRSNYPLVVNVDDRSDGLRLGVQALAQVDGARVCGYLQTALQQLLAALEHTPQAPLRSLSILSAEEKQRVLVGFNASARVYPKALTLPRRFEAQAALRPDAIAVVQGRHSLSYRELNAQANRLAHHLLSLGVNADDRVALCLRRGPALLLGMLGILKAGAAYVPIDPAHPAERIAYLLQDSGPVAVLAQASTGALLGDVAFIDLDGNDWQRHSEANLERAALTPSNLAYVIYTSGSTGQPKGVMVEHGSVENLLHWHCETFDLHAGSHTASVAGIGFDAMAWEVWPALCSGATLHLPPASVGNENVEALLDWWLAQPLEVAFLPTPLAELAFSRPVQHPTLRTLLIGGDRLRQFPRNQRFAVINNYGPTEATVVATSGAVKAGKVLHIGKPIANTRVYVLDAQQRPVPVGVEGELYVGGAGVARGYLNRPELTAERFLNDPFSNEPQARMYRTGDLVRWLVDGTLEYLGRNDDQVKLRGVRVELGEIEAALASHAAVREVVAQVRDGQLVVWFCGHAPVSIEQLHAHVQARLPQTLLPCAYMRLDSLPLTANGKLDHKALPSPDREAMLSRAYEAPQGEVETALAQIWVDVLKVERVGRHDHFFELGGHSLLAVSLIERMRQRGMSTDVRALFSQPTLAALAAAVGSGSEVTVPANLIPPGCQRITPDMLTLVELEQSSIERIVASVPGGAANVQDIYPLAPLQEGILYHHLSTEQGDPYLLQSRMAFDSLERLQRFAAALQQVMDRHDILRTSVVWEGLPTAQQVVWRKARLPVQEVTLEPAEGDVLGQLQARFDARHYRLDLTQAPLLRMVYAHDPDQQRVVAILLFHHIALDHTAMKGVGQEMATFLLAQGEQPGAAMPYRNYVAQARLGADEQAHEAFFRDMLGAIDAPTLPQGVLEVAQGAEVESALQTLPQALSRRLREQARQLGVSTASLMHLAWAQVLGMLANRREVVFGTVLLGRLQGGEGADRALGVFINTLPLRVDVGAGVRDAAKATHSVLNALQGHEHASLTLAQRCSGVGASAPLFSALINYRHSSGQRPQDGQGIWEGVQLLGGEGRSNYPLTLSVDDLGDGFELSVLAVEAIGAQQVCAYMRSALGQMVQALELTPERALNHLPILSLAEQQHLLRDFNASATAYPRGQTLHGLVEAQVTAAPQAIAVRQGSQALTYGQLNQQANQLAHHLIGLGVQPDDRVALCLRRGPAMLVGMLGILKAGAAYVPIDPAHPAERIAYLLQDSNPVAVLAQASTGALLGDTAFIDLDGRDWQQHSAANPQLAWLTPSHLAYVIYTSGSTGQPKGVMVEHITLENLLHWHCETFDLRAGSHTASVAGVGFDAMAWEVWPALCSGATLHLPPASVGNENVEELLDWWLAQPLEVGFLPTPLAELAFSRPVQHPTLRTLLIGGDRLRQFPRNQRFAVINNYGPTEATVVATSGLIEAGQVLHIGKPIANTRVYVLDAQQRPVPVGVEGELYVGGAGVARGYLNRPELTEERFLNDPFSDEPQARMYRTGDLVRWLADGTLEYLGRNDDQVKLRGVRVELGEIDAALCSHDSVRDAVALVRDGRLVAWFCAHDALDIEALHAYLQTRLPAALLPSAYVRLDALPLTANGKLDRKALPSPDQEALLSRAYEAPQGEVETALAQIWADLLKVERVGRHDHFFELGGHSLLAVSLIERMRQKGLSTDVRVLFNQPTLAALAAAVGSGCEVVVPANLIPAGCQRITPDMLTLVELEQSSIDRIVASVPGGAANVQDIYPLAPLQEGILYHHLSAEQGDPYVLQSRLAFDTLERLQAFAQALKAVMTRHDILRTAVLWEQLPAPLQVVWRHAELPLLTVELDPLAGDALQQLHARFDARHYRLDLTQAPLLRIVYAHDPLQQRVVAILLFHHIALDHTALAVVAEEMQAILHGSAALEQAVPYRHYVAQARLGVSQPAHEAFFREQLADIDEPVLPFDLHDVQGDGQHIAQATRAVPAGVGQRLRSQARHLGVSVASLFHLAWARVVGLTANTDSAVFGTVLLGRLQGGEGADRALGMFINTLPLRIELGDTSVRAGVKATHAGLSALLAHEHASLALAQRCSGVAAPLPLFSAMLNYRHSASQASTPTWDGIEMLASEERTNYPLSMTVDDHGDAFSLTAKTVAAIAAERVCGYMEQALTGLVDALEHTPQLPLSQLNILGAGEQHRLLAEFNATEQPCALDSTWQRLFEAQVQRTPDAIAVQAGAQQLTYRALNTQANQLAQHLRTLGVQPDTRVAICVERGLELMVGLLAILKAGGAYVPLDPGYPAERLAYMLHDSAPVAVLVQAATREVLAADSRLPRIDFDQPSWHGLPGDNPDVPGLTASSLAYVIYTSGSTGTPKGVMIEHRGLCNLMHWAAQISPPLVGGALLQKAPFSFDGSVWELFWPLTAGLRLVMARPDGHRDPHYLAQVIREQRISVVKFVPALLQQFLALDEARQCSSLTDLFCGGGDLTAALARSVRECLPQVRLHNVYGPTEATVDSTAWTLEANRPVPDTLPIGRPICNTRHYVLDAHRQPLPIGVSGELYIGGVGVARGYLDLAPLTAERFIDSPFVPGDRLYSTGDRVRYRDDGTLEFLGRTDFQIKLRGLRVEPGEIEARLAEYPAVREALVLVRDERLVAYFTYRHPVEVDTLRRHLLAQMPDYMVPSAFVALEHWPLTPNGKVDRRALPAPGADALIVREYAAPLGETEQQLAQIWAELLKLERVGRHDNFFELGGHSLLAMSLIERMRQQGLSTDVRVLFSQPTLAALAGAVGSGREVAVPANLIPEDCSYITPQMLPLLELDQPAIERIVATVPGGAANVQDIYPLAPLQEGILYHHLSAAQGDPYVLQTRLTFASSERLQAFAQALQSVIARHDILRSAMLWEGLSTPVQVVWRTAELALQEVLLDAADGDIFEQLRQRFDARDYRLPIDQAPLMRLIHAYDPQHGRIVAILLFHHMIMDHTALEVVGEEMQAGLLGRGAALAPSVPYRNYVTQARLGVSQQEHEAFFREMLGDIDEPTLPFGLKDVQGDGRNIVEATVSLPAATGQRLRSQARHLGVSVASLFHLAWARVLSVTANQDSVVFGTVLLGRLQGGAGADRGLGMFINTLPLRVDLAGTSVRDGVKATHARLSALLGHEHASLALAQRCSRVAAPLPLFSAMLNYRHSYSRTIAQDTRQAWEGIETLASEERTNYPLTLNVDDLGTGFSLNVMTPAAIGAERVCGYMQQALSTLIEALEQTPQLPLGQLSILEAAELQRLLYDFNATYASYDLEQTLHGLFEAQARRTPQALAVQAQAGALTYAELDQQANRLAQHLRGLGVQADARVAICVERGLEMVVGLLAILKAGGAYVPLDPAYPQERLAYMLADSAPVAVLVQGETRGLLADVRVPVIDLDHCTWQAQPATAPQLPGLTAQHLAYVIYTSGSTGQPKGVMNEHRAVVNRLLWMQEAYGLGAGDAVLQKTPFSFDVSVWEFFWPLMTGARLVMARPGGHKDPAYLGEIIQAERITTAHFVPSMLDVFLAHGAGEHCTGLKQVMCSGEALPGGLVRRFLTQLPGCALHNLYGPTEAAVDVTAWHCAGPLAQVPDNTPIGRPIANTRMYVLDANQQPVPLGVVGELYIAGVQVARGYLNRAELTEERFLKDPFSPQPQARMYRTGDIARYRPDGALEYLGRNDDQVKIRGLRIELGEIQARLTALAEVNEAVVLAREDAPGDQRLVAYYTAGVALPAEQLRAELLAQLPDYMVPAVFVHLQTLPLSPNGKLDRKALPAPGLESLIVREYQAPIGATEILLAGIWAELLGVERVGRHDHFFELGGHSLLAVSLIGRLRQHGLQADVRALFEQPTLADYAAITERMEIVL